MFSNIENNEDLNRPKENYTKIYRDKDREKYNKSQRDLYHRLKENEEWKRNFNEKQLYITRNIGRKRKRRFWRAGLSLDREGDQENLLLLKL